MRAILCSLSALVLLPATLPLQAAEVLVQGRVLEEGSEAPVANAYVALRKGSRGAPVMTETGADGGFQFKLEEGPATFRLGVGRTQSMIQLDGKTWELNAAKLEPIILRLPPDLRIAGRVLDAETGSPVQGLQVTPHQYRGTGAGRLLAAAGSTAKTDQDGRFLLTELKAGDYYLELRQPLGTEFHRPKPEENFTENVRMGYGRYWYPGVSEAAQSSAIQVMAPRGVEGVDFRISKTPLAALRGRLLDAPGVGPVSLVLQETRTALNSSSLAIAARGQLLPGEAFEIDQITPGTYTLIAMTSAQTMEKLAAIRHVQVMERNQEGLELQLQPPVRINGRMRIDGREPTDQIPALPNPVPVAVETASKLPIQGRQPPDASMADGLFAVDGVIPDRLRVSVPRPPAGYRMREVRYNGVPAPQGFFDVDPAATAQQLEILLAPATATVVAAVTDGSNPLDQATVLLVSDPIPEPFTGHALLVGRSNRDGRATIGNLLPGTYRAVAFPNGSLWMDDPYLRERLANGQEVQVSDRSSTSISLRAEPPQ